MWEPEGKPIAVESLGPLAPEDVLFEFEEPLTFVCKDPDGQLLLAHNLSTEGSISRYLISVTDRSIIRELRAGRLDLLGSLRQPRCWLADVAANWEVVGLWLIAFDRVPKDYLPLAGSMMSPDLDPIFRLRLVGPGVGLGRTSAADIRLAAEGAESGLRGLARIALDARKRSGPVSRAVRDFSDLPYQFTRAASFEIAFGRPAGRLTSVDDEVFREMGRLLDLGLTDLRENGDDASPIKDLDPEQTLQLYEAIKAFTPPTRGGVDRVEVGGGLVESFDGPKVLTRDDRVRTVRRIKTARKAPRLDEPFRAAGIVEEADQGEYSFILRHLGPQVTPTMGPVTEIRFRFDNHLFDAVMEAFNSSDRMVVIGQRVGAAHKALDIQLDVGPESLVPDDDEPRSE